MKARIIRMDSQSSPARGLVARSSFFSYYRKTVYLRWLKNFVEHGFHWGLDFKTAFGKYTGLSVFGNPSHLYYNWGKDRMKGISDVCVVIRL